MPKLFKLLRGQKRRSSLTPSSPLSKKKREQGIFRRKSTGRSTKKARTEAPVIEVARTYSLSEDEESCDIILSSNADIENQSSAEYLGDVYDDFSFEKAQGPIVTRGIADVRVVDSLEPETDTSSTKAKENDKIMTFTHLEVMRNELAHMMQIANKDKEIHELKQDAEQMNVQHAEIVASKDAEISRLEKALAEVESCLSLAQNKLASEEEEHSKTIAVLMETQYEFHELNNKSWFQPLCIFS